MKRRRPAPSLPAFLFLLVLLPLAASVTFQPVAQSDNHQAHAKPGGPYFLIDWDRVGYKKLTISAADSHTHYFSHGPPPVSGKIVLYEWYSTATGALLLNTSLPKFTATFYRGISILKLIVTDSTGDTASAYTYVSLRLPHPYESSYPSLSRVSPALGPVFGGTIVSVFGTAFYNNPIIIFAGEDITPEIISDKELRFRVPAVPKPRTVRVFVSNGFGTSAQFITFRYVAASGTPVRFKEDFVKTVTGAPYSIPELTAIKLGPDGKYYAGSLNGYVHIFTLDRSLAVREYCKSANAGRGRSILGLAFNPNEHWPIKLYLTTSTLFWPTKPATGANWDNGKVEVWGKKSDADCLSHFYTLVSGLPVSAKDHAVNQLLFDSDGTLLVAVGGSTNAGVHTHNDSTGGVPESPLSGAILRFNMFNADFDGHITYTGYSDPGTAFIQSGTVQVFASGLRNVYGMTLHSNGKLYALDNGPNNGFGAGAATCNIPGKQVWFSDKLLQVREGGFYGHPNWNRARYDPRQCAYVSGDTASREPAYTGPMTILGSSMTGILEYTANTFNSKLRGQLLLSKLSWEGLGLLLSAKLDGTGEKVKGPPLQVFGDSGIAIEMGAFGELIMPKIKQSKILALVPDEEFADGLTVIAVVPRRGPALGGNKVLVTGSGFTADVKIFFGNLECTDYGTIAPDGSSIICEVPRFDSGSRIVSVVARFQNLQSIPSKQGEYEYMKQ